MIYMFLAHLLKNKFRHKPKRKHKYYSIHTFSYKLLGERLEFLYPHLTILEIKIKQAGIPIPLEFYISSMVFLGLVTGVLGMLIGILLPFSFDMASIETTIVTTISGALFGSVTTIGLVYIIPYVRAGTRRRALELDLPYYLGYMSILASSGLNIEEIFRIVARESIKNEIVRDAKILIHSIDMLGMDIINAIQDLIYRSPSKIYNELLEGLISTIRSGGNLKDYFSYIAHIQFIEKKLTMKRLISSLGILAEIYTTMLVVFPLLGIIMLSVMSTMAKDLGGLDFMLLMNLLTFVFVPAVGSMLLLMIESMIPKR